MPFDPIAFGTLHGDPLAFMSMAWPDAGLYDKEQEMVLSCRDSIETIVVAGNMLGKDYTVGIICPTFFIAPQLFFPISYVREVESRRRPGYDPHTRRVVTTSVKDEHLDILWGEIGRHVKTCKLPLDDLLYVTTHEIRFREEAEAKNPVNYLKGMVSKTGEGLAGHHAAYTLFACDEASAMDDMAYKAAQGWAKRIFLFGNPHDCSNSWRTNYEAGNVLAQITAA